MEDSTRLEDLMLAMDVVDTLRHREQWLDQELDGDDQGDALIEKLRRIYTAQGIEVSDELLAEGVAALQQDRFKYSPPARTFSSYFAHLYVIRDRWLRPVLIAFTVFVVTLVLFYLIAIRPLKLAEENLPNHLVHTYELIEQISKEKTTISRAHDLEMAGQQALKQSNYREAQLSLDQLRMILDQLQVVYQLRIVQQVGRPSGVWRIPDVNSQAKNYYLIVEAIDPKGEVLMLPKLSEETARTRVVDQWGIRVDQVTFQQFTADKLDDGIIQQRQVGEKKRGYMQVDYSIASDGSAITDW